MENVVQTQLLIKMLIIDLLYNISSYIVC